MKLNRPSLILYFLACILVIFFKLLEWNSCVLYAKSIIIPLVFIYYFITNNYKISLVKALVFLFCFIGDIFNLLKFNDFGLGALLSFLLVYILLLKLAIDDFRSLKLNKSDRVSIFASFVFVATICVSILTLQFEKMVLDFTLVVFYGIILAFLIFFSTVNYLLKGNYVFFNSVLMCACFMVSDIFFMINKFYFALYTFSFINVFVQVFSYYFMATYFIEKDKILQKQSNEKLF